MDKRIPADRTDYTEASGEVPIGAPSPRDRRDETGNCHNYAIVTAAFNEAKNIETTIEAVLSQTVHPVVWMIVDDGSSDETAALVLRYCSQFPWIRLHRRQRSEGNSYFASNVGAIMEGVAIIRQLEFEYLAILDADMALPIDYYETILDRFRSDPRLGIASGVYENLVRGKLQPWLSDRRSAPQAIQVFRRPCFETIRGFRPLRLGGTDTCACVMARMSGWKTWSFPDVKAVHLRPTGMGETGSVIKARYKQGLVEFGLGAHPLFVFVKSLRRCLLERPYIAAGLARFLGFMSGYFKRVARDVPEDFVGFLRREQWNRLVHWNRVPDEHAYHGEVR